MPSVISGDANVSASEFGFLDGVTSGLQSQINSKLNLAGGKILQIVSATHATSTSTTSTSAVTTGLSATITPSATNSRVLVLATTPAGSANAGLWIGIFSLHRGTFPGTSLGEFASLFTSHTSLQSPVSIQYLDSPATTSATTYTLGMRVANSNGSVNAQGNNYIGVMTLMEVSA